jgi:hypothetical protein
MPITYDYLLDGAPFTADSLNTRFEPALGGGNGVNQITDTDVGVGAFRHNHLPCMLHKAGVVESDLAGIASFAPPQTSFTLETDTSFGDSKLVASRSASSPTVLFTMSYLSQVQYKLGMGEDDRVGAVVLLANVEVTRFITQREVDGSEAIAGSATISDLDEDRHAIVFAIQVEQGTVNTLLTSTVRSLSPRVTITDLATVRSPESGDTWTKQDVAIRSVLRKADLTSASAITRFRLVAYMVDLPGTNLELYGVTVSKCNLTAIPLHTKLNVV